MKQSGPTSLIASTLLITHILRSHECLSTTYHRLIFGLSVADIISSIGFSLSSIMAPKEMNYLVPFASGSTATCDAQGFLNVYAIIVSVGYNCSVCFYYLAIISYSKKYDYIKEKLEPWFHGISVSFPLVIGVIGLAANSFNGTNGGICYSDAHYPPHCIGYETGDIPKGYSIPCGRGGDEDDNTVLRTIAMIGALLWVLIFAPITTSITMASMFRSVSQVEKRMQNYGVSALRIRTRINNSNDPTDSQEQEAKGFTNK
jgi:hypothetical protein